MNAPNNLLQRLSIQEQRSHLITYTKAVRNLDAEDRKLYIDSSVASYIHDRLHDLVDAALEYRSGGREETGAFMKSLVGHLAHDFAAYPMDFADRLPQTLHLAERHEYVAGVLNRVANGEATTELAIEDISQNLGQDPLHNRQDLMSNVFRKSSENFGTLGIPPYAPFNLNAMSRFRPSPPFLYDTFTPPDQRYVRFLTELKKNGLYDPNTTDFPNARPPLPLPDSTLSERAGVPDLIVGVDGTLSAKGAPPLGTSYQKGQTAEYIMSRLRQPIPLRLLQASRRWQD